MPDEIDDDAMLPGVTSVTVLLSRLSLTEKSMSRKSHGSESTSKSRSSPANIQSSAGTYLKTFSSSSSFSPGKVFHLLRSVYWCNDSSLSWGMCPLWAPFRTLEHGGWGWGLRLVAKTVLRLATFQSKRFGWISLASQSKRVPESRFENVRVSSILWVVSPRHFVISSK
jgi:hypothetical protein